MTVYERHPTLGGTTALSGGNAWLPANRFLQDDTPELALAYLRALSLGDTDDALLQMFAHEARGTADWLERETRVDLQPIPYTDYHAEFPGGREQGGRTLEPQPLLPRPDVAELVRDAPNVTAPVTYVELAGGEIDRAALRERAEKGIFTLGRALLAGLLEACLDAGVEIRAGERVRQLPEGAVVLATGGFERDPQLAKAFLRGPVLAPVGAPTAEGDGLRMAIAAGAQLGGMSEAWWCPALSIPGETIDGAPMHRLILTERARPGCLLVDSSGRRFADEAQNYNDLGRTLLNFEPTSYSLPPRPGVADLRRRLPLEVPDRPAVAARPGPGLARPRATRSPAWPARSARRPTALEATVDALQRARRATARTRTSAAARSRTTASSARSAR